MKNIRTFQCFNYYEQERENGGRIAELMKQLNQSNLGGWKSYIAVVVENLITILCSQPLVLGVTAGYLPTDERFGPKIDDNVRRSETFYKCLVFIMLAEQA